jgi:hypothetical protein
MPRMPRAALLVLTLIGAFPATGALAQDDPASTAGHPFVGAWLVDTNTAEDSEPHSRLVVHPDGTLLQVDQTTVAVGAWAPTSAQTADLTIAAQVDMGDGQVATITVRANVTMDPAGDAWTGEASVERVDAAGDASGQMGPIPAAATRIVVEPMVPTASPGF